MRHYLLKKQTFFYREEECLLVHIRDVTEYLELQEERQKNHMMKMLSATVSHDMMSPIQNIKFFSEQMFEACLDRDIGQVEHFLRMLSETGNMLKSRVKDLLDQNLIDHNKFVPVEAIFSAQTTVEPFKNILENQLKFHDVKIVCQYEERSLENNLIGDVDRIQQVLLNLTSNAAKYVPRRGGEIRISAEVLD